MSAHHDPQGVELPPVGQERDPDLRDDAINLATLREGVCQVGEIEEEVYTRELSPADATEVLTRFFADLCRRIGR